VDKMQKIFVVGLILLILLVPLGLLAAGEAFGEWGPDELKEKVGFVPQGLEKLTGIWNAPLKDYNLPGDPDAFYLQTIGYYLSAVIGMCIGGTLLYFIGRKVAKS